MTISQCKKCRHAGVKLFLKGERCFSPKCGITRRSTAPGIHGKKRRRSFSEYGLQLQEKQKLQRIYGLGGRQFKNYIKKALRKKGVSAETLMQMLETRLDNTVFRLGWANSRAQARQLTVHGFFKINKRKVNRPSFHLKNGYVVLINEVKMKSPIIETIKKKIKKYSAPDWLELDKESLKGTVKNIPTLQKINPGVDLRKIIEFYSH